MSPFFANARTEPPCFPRVSGDEPIRVDLDALINEFSPRERG